jgi:hypothetical protein
MHICREAHIGLWTSKTVRRLSERAPSQRVIATSMGRRRIGPKPVWWTSSPKSPFGRAFYGVLPRRQRGRRVIALDSNSTGSTEGDSSSAQADRGRRNHHRKCRSLGGSAKQTVKISCETWTQLRHLPRRHPPLPVGVLRWRRLVRPATHRPQFPWAAACGPPRSPPFAPVLRVAVESELRETGP